MISLQVLYDDVLRREISLPRTVLGLAGEGNLTFNELNNRPLILPSLIFPFRRAIYYMAYFAYDTALASRRQHNCARASSPDEAGWLIIKNASIESSNCGDSLFFCGGDYDEDD